MDRAATANVKQNRVMNRKRRQGKKREEKYGDALPSSSSVRLEILRVKIRQWYSV